MRNKKWHVIQYNKENDTPKKYARFKRIQTVE